MLNTKEVIKDLEGLSFVDSDGQTPLTYGKLIARILSRAKHQEAERCIELALKFLSQEKIKEMLQTDIDFILNLVKQDQLVSNLIEYRVKEYLSKCNSSSPKA